MRERDYDLKKTRRSAFETLVRLGKVIYPGAENFVFAFDEKWSGEIHQYGGASESGIVTATVFLSCNVIDLENETRSAS